MDCGISYGSLAMLGAIATTFGLSWYKVKRDENKQLKKKNPVQEEASLQAI